MICILYIIKSLTEQTINNDKNRRRRPYINKTFSTKLPNFINLTNLNWNKNSIVEGDLDEI